MNFSVSPAADYKLSGRTVTFDHSNNLFCTVTDGSKGYIKLNDKYARLLIPVMKCASKGSFVSSNTTLHYIDTIGHYRMHVIGDVKFNQTDSTQWIIQLDALDGGVQGIVGLSNTNWGSVLTLTLGMSACSKRLWLLTSVTWKRVGCLLPICKSHIREDCSVLHGSR